MKVFQIYYKQEQTQFLVPEFTPVFNKKCTLFFENQVILDLMNDQLHWQTDYFGVVSHSFKKKVESGFNLSDFGNFVGLNKPDVAVFVNYEECNPIDQADVWHPGFKQHFTKLIKKIGYEYTDSVYKPIHSNFFIARPELYEKYVMNWLLPAMYATEDMPELLEPCEYPGHPFPDFLKKDLGVDHWMWHPFLLERLFGYFCQHHQLNVKHFK